MWFQRRIFLDFAGGTPCAPEAAQAYQRALAIVGNPGALHTEGEEARLLLENARKEVARLLEVRPGSVYFTSGATEGNNLVCNGVRQHKTGHVIVSAIEHQSVLAPVRQLEKEGYAVTYLKPQPDGRVSPTALREALRPDTRLVSIGWVNSETGVVQPLHKLSAEVRAFEKEHKVRIVMHADAGQAPLMLPSIVSGLGVDALTLDSGKLYGPRGVGALYLREKDMAQPLMYGGGQEDGLRPGTENVALASGFAAACTRAHVQYKNDASQMEALRLLCLNAIQNGIPDVVCNESPKHQAPHILNISIKGIDPEYVVLRLDARGVAISTKSACEERERVSHVVAATVPPEEMWRASTTLRISFGRSTTKREVEKAAKEIIAATALSRKFAESQK